ncbi:MAG: chromosome segregation protein SMC [Bdellovibrionota bacterium]
MKIKRLELTGFKSFLEKTQFEFDVPITSVVGPNGCGKSNIVDALKWVTGELSYKELRGRNSEDLIFAGSDRRPPTSMMEVTLTLDNDARTAPAQYNDYSEISVLRRIFRDGTSEFFINKTPCRLRDIIDLFLDTGIGQISYSIIEQGKIGAIVSSRAEDRRMMIEEAAGITKFKNRKKAAERKMEYTKQNLLRVNDVTSELKKQISSLERQAKKAEKYHELKKDFESLDIEIAVSDYSHIKSEIESCKKFEQQIQDSLVQFGSTLSETQAAHENEKTTLEEVEQKFQQSQQNLFAQKNEINKSTHQKETKMQDELRLSDLLKESEQKVQQLSSKIEENKTKIDAIQTELTKLEEIKSGFQKQFEEKNEIVQNNSKLLQEEEQNLEQIKRQDIELSKKENALLNAIQSKKNRQQELNGEIEKNQKQFDSLRAEIKEKEDKHLTYKTSLEEISQMCFSFEENQKNIRASIEVLDSRKSDLHKEILSLEKQINEYQTRLTALQEFSSTYQGYAKGVQQIMVHREKGDQRFQNVIGVLGHLVKPHKGYQKAVQAALDKFVECIVVKDHQDTIAYLEHLESENSRGIFLSGSFDNTYTHERFSDPAILGNLLDFVDIDPSLQKSISYLFGQTYVVKSVQDALELQTKGCRASFVTLKGEVLSDHGVLQGGSLDGSLGDFEVQAQIDELKEKLEPIVVDKKNKDDEYRQVVADLDNQTKQLKAISENLERELRKNLDLEKEFQKVEDQLGFTKEKLSEVAEKVSLYTEEKNKIGTSLDELDTELVGITGEKEKFIQILEASQLAVKESKEKYEASYEESNELKVQFSSSVERIEGYTRELTIVSSQLQDFASEKEKTLALINQSKQKLVETKEQLFELSKNIEQATELYRTLESSNSVLQSQHDEVLESIRRIELILKDTREAREEKQTELNQLQVRISEHSMHMNHLQQQVEEKYEKNLYEICNDQTVEVLTVEEVSERKGQLGDIKSKIEKIGNVNLAAIEEIQEHTQRYDFLMEQKNDLEKSLESLSEAIKKINKTSKEKFEETYKAVSEKFSEIFPRLFQGGKGRLVLTDEENILTSGVDIQAQPPGKKLQNMNLLSGGEKALTAIALLFAIFEYKAPPFCVLDEVDAPLDDVNVLRYVSIVERMAKQTQFIVITHNKRTMEMADNLYGVTMEEPGVSRVVSVRLNQDQFIEKQAMEAGDQNRSVA